MNHKRMIVYILYCFFGVVLLGLGAAEMVDSFWSGMGSAFILIGLLRLVRMYRFHKDANYREKVEVEIADERNRFIRNKAWAWAGYLFILIAGVATIVLKVAGQDLLSYAASMTVCLMLVLYWISFLIIRKKY